MNSYTNSNQLPLEQQRRHLEALLQTPSSSGNGLSQALTQMGKGLVHWLTSGSQPRITQIQRGDTEMWKVYDPIDSQVLYFDHEDQVRAWLDDRHNG
ncbi:MAG: hypothetical protein ACFB0C_21980 [Leptolyngbyaceae cyanobacterium]